MDKTEIIPACPSAQSFGPGDFQGCSWNGTSNFKLLGAPVGSNEWCEELLGRRIAKARALLSAIGKFPDAQGAFCSLRSCSGGLRSSTLVALCPQMPSRVVSGQRTAIFVRPWASSLVAPCLGMTGAWLLSASLQAGSEPGVLLNMLLLLTTQAFPIVGDCAVNPGRLSTLSTWTRVAT